MPIFKRDADRSDRVGTTGERAVRRLRILVVDEDPTARSVIARRLSHLNHDVAVAENGFVTLNILLTHPFDIVLVDMAMALLPGIATMQKMRASGLLRDASVVLISGRSDSRGAVDALEAGADDHIAKPFDFDVLDARLRHLRARAEAVGALSRHNADLDARIARRAMELGETRDALGSLQADRARLVSSIQALHDEIERLNAAQG